eukprot:6650705-Pyramimonas_sp.AAC.2
MASGRGEPSGRCGPRSGSPWRCRRRGWTRRGPAPVWSSLTGAGACKCAAGPLSTMAWSPDTHTRTSTHPPCHPYTIVSL